ncbi:MAG: hypothetical protein ABI237_12105 [Ginsengibacter sp.]
MNIKLSYLYRDASNYKQFHEVVFANPNDIPFKEILPLIRSRLIDGCWFIAKDWNLPDMHFKEYDWDEEVDHEWHEVESIVETAEAEVQAVSIEDFLEIIRRPVF